MSSRPLPSATWRATVVVAVVAAVLLTLVPPVSAKTAAGFQGGVRSRTNAVRVERDLPQLRKESCVQKYAARQARRMAKQGKMFHQDLKPVLRNCSLTSVGENVAYGYSSATDVLKAWMDSAPHRANIVKKRYRLLGVGARKSASGTWYLAQVFGRK
ncbi:Cysteine-rich secretory protein family protein [Nocardioides dokdonensis FR1436]|uniref:Cysteine-rich secretory protein family protein n=1 Tax=Nocardioides dokdonensis FR1436 TaxID=1300347 RepID=A0A1A9GLX0_9ACTN|nr:CAP domain-containing protein [Nocardioides dokdonensis]ANH38680.1 Cysteine-rich secretory protein family protein [Nocardioides dokdonensis FR1436]